MREAEGSLVFTSWRPRGRERAKLFNFQGTRQTMVAGKDETSDGTMVVLCDWLTRSGVTPEDNLLSRSYTSATRMAHAPGSPRDQTTGDVEIQGSGDETLR